MPGDVRPAFAEGEAARQVLNDAEDDLRRYQLDVEPIHSKAGNLGLGAMPGAAATTTATTGESAPESTNYESTARSESPVGIEHDKAGSSPYPLQEADRIDAQHQETSRPQVANVA